jgi:hypothetical protein
VKQSWLYYANKTIGNFFIKFTTFVLTYMLIGSADVIVSPSGNGQCLSLRNLNTSNKLTFGCLLSTRTLFNSAM